ncbi:hypothetical protein [Candidatus Pantoea persica]|uniref:hypothetical protein n=1 Tax=Candidatus Pantoea persica TaxID=2518128 RepID=UPI00215D987C|nr:hypothetical protein [Candidatus Pantoea persica]MBA2816697.1 putative peptidoglycan biosynthesis protein MurJ [Candidatus Pantoea persica]
MTLRIGVVGLGSIAQKAWLPVMALAEKRGRRLMVGFNRRFAPRYQQLRQAMPQAESLRMEKHRSDSVGPQDLRFTLLDDYLHVIDTPLWLAGWLAGGAAHHFIQCVQKTMPETSGEQALLAQRVVEKLWREAEKE